MSSPNVTVSLRIQGDALNPQEITAALKTQPSSAIQKGQDIVTGGYVRKSPTGLWLLKIQAHQTDEFDDQVQRILNIVSNDLETWHHLSACFYTELFV